MRENKRFRLIARLLIGRKGKQTDSFSKKVESDPELAKEISQMKSIWQHETPLIESTPVENMWQDFQKRLRYEENAARRALYQHARNRRATRRSFAYAFAVLLLLIVPVSLYFYSTWKTTEHTI